MRSCQNTCHGSSGRAARDSQTFRLWERSYRVENNTSLQDRENAFKLYQATILNKIREQCVYRHIAMNTPLFGS